MSGSFRLLVEPGVEPGSGNDPATALLTVVDLADDAVIGVADEWGVRRPRPGVVGGAVVGSVPWCSAW
jgi:hypothetical protein